MPPGRLRSSAPVRAHRNGATRMRHGGAPLAQACAAGRHGVRTKLA
ncbi:hypothetical protein [Burkholderia ubonensis]|nr:hypothetical protein [Burkholderia ubonensis]MDY7786705.1 hypothetical protein [Burkholderia ubonensis]